MTTQHACHRCGRQLDGFAPLGLCPRCLARDAVALPEEEEAVGSTEDVPAVPAGTSARRFGDYELLGEIERGGMGVVYRARQISLDRIVAVKMILAEEWAGPLSIERFRAEAQAAARLQHPGIVQIHEVGEHEGRHYYSMDYVEGRNLEQVARSRPLAPMHAAQYARGIAEAVHYAHAQGVLHRDLKPSNILIDAADRPRITDFGLAKRLVADPGLTLPAQAVGTPNYMSPEQVASGDAAAGGDIYSIGAVLYFLLTGRPPFLAATLPEIMRQVAHREPVSPRLLSPGVPRDLETICLKCLEKDLQRRFATAQALADDLGRFLGGEAILARPVGAPGRLWRWCRRNPAVASLAGWILLLLVAVAVVASSMTLLLSRERNAALRAEQSAEQHLWQARLAQANARRWSDRPGRRVDALDALAQAAALRPAIELRNEAIACMALADLRLAHRWDLGPPPGAMPAHQAMSFSPQLDRYVCSDETGNLTLRRVPDAAELLRLPGPGQPAWLTRFSPGGRYLAAKYHPFSGNASNRVWVWDLASGKVLWKSTHAVADHAIDFSSDERWLALGAIDRSISIYEAGTGKVVEQWPALPGVLVRTVRFQPGGSKLAVVTLPDVVHLRELPGGRMLRELRAPALVHGISWHPRRELLAAAVYDGTLRVYETDTGRERCLIEGGPAKPTKVAYAGDGEFLASYWSDMTLRLSHALGGTALLSVPQVVVADELSFDPSSKLLAHAIIGGEVSLFEVVAAPECRALLGEPSSGEAFYSPVSYSPDGALVACAYAGGVRIWDHRHGEQVALIPGEGWVAAEFVPGGPSLLTSGATGLLRWPINPTADGQVVNIGPPKRIALPAGVAPGRIAISRDGRMLAAVIGQSVVLLDLATETQKMRFDGFKGLESVALSPNARWLACCTWRGSGLQVIDLSTGEVAARPADSANAAAEFSPDGRWMATGTEREYRLWSVPRWQLVARMPANGMYDLPGRMAFSPDSRMVAIVPSWFAARLVEVPSGRELATFQAPDVRQRIDALRFSPNGGFLAAGNRECRVHAWDLRRVRQRLATMQLDWEAPPIPPSTATASVGVIHVIPQR